MPEQEDVFDTDSVDVEVDEPAKAIVNQYESSISIGGVTTLPAGSNATVTNSGTESDVVLNFGIPKGDSGNEWGEISGILVDQTDLKDALDAKADANNTALTGIPTAPTASSGTNTTQIATTQFVSQAIGEMAATLRSYIDSSVINMLKRMNFSNAIVTTIDPSSTNNTYVCHSNGYVSIWGTTTETSTQGGISINGNQVATLKYPSESSIVLPVSDGDFIASTSSVSNSMMHITFIPMMQ